MIWKQEEIQEEMFQNFKVCTSEYKESDKRKRQEIDLQFQKQEEQEKEALKQEMKEEIQLEEELWFQKEVDKGTVAGGSGAAVDASYMNMGKQQQEIELNLQIQEQQKDEELQ